MTKKEEKEYLVFIENLHATYGVAKLDYLVHTKAYEILGMSKEDSFQANYSQERFDLIKREFANKKEVLNFGRDLVTKSATILKNPVSRSTYDAKILYYKENSLWDGIRVMAADGSLKQSEFKKALKIATENGLSESDLIKLLKKNSVIVQSDDAEPLVSVVGGLPKIKIEGNASFHPSKGFDLKDVPISERVTKVLKVYNEGGGEFKADISTPFPWISFNQSTIRHKDLPFNLEIIIQLKKDKTAVIGKKFTGFFDIKTSNEKKRIPVLVAAENQDYLREVNTKKSTVFASRLAIFFLLGSTIVSFYNQYKLDGKPGGMNYVLMFLAVILLFFQSNLYRKKSYYNEKVVYLGAALFVYLHVWNILFLTITPVVNFLSKHFFEKYAERKKAIQIIPLLYTGVIVSTFVLNSLYDSFPIYEKLTGEKEVQTFAFSYTGVVNSKGLNLRQAPTKNSQSIQILKKEQPVTIYTNEELGNMEWLYISTEINGVQYRGYVLSKYIKVNQ